MDARKIILKFVELGPPRPEIIIVECHEKEGFLVAFAIDHATESIDRELRNAVSLTNLGDSVEGQFLCQLWIDMSNTHRLPPAGAD